MPCNTTKNDVPQHVVLCSVLETYILSASLIILPTGCYFTYYWLNQTKVFNAFFFGDQGNQNFRW